VRCGLERPVCFNCSKLSRQCIYRDAVNEPNLSILDTHSETFLAVQLMYHYASHSYLTITYQPKLTTLWKDYIPKLALQHRFLLLEILAFAAHHKLHEVPDDAADFLDLANNYHQQALAEYMVQLNDINEDNCKALFAFSQILVGVASSHLLSRIREGDPVPDILDHFMGTCRLLRGALAIADKTHVWLWASELKPLSHNMMEDSRQIDHSQLHRVFEQHLEILVGQIAAKQAEETASDHGEILTSAVRLASRLPLDAGMPDALNYILSYPIFLDQKFFDLIDQRDHLALVVLGYYCVALHQLRRTWWIAEMGIIVFDEIASVLGNTSTELAWPRAMIKGDD
jgi:hypothetical protein